MKRDEKKRKVRYNYPRKAVSIPIARNEVGLVFPRERENSLRQNAFRVFQKRDERRSRATQTSGDGVSANDRDRLTFPRVIFRP